MENKYLKTEETAQLGIGTVMLSLPSQEEIDEQIDRYAFRVPYDRLFAIFID